MSENIQQLKEDMKDLQKQVSNLQDWVEDHKHKLNGEAYCKVEKQIWDW